MGKTRLDKHVDAPSTVEPGEAPHDTTDVTERAISVAPDTAKAAAAGHQTVNAVVPASPREPAKRDTSKDRMETYEAVTPSGETVKITRNIETGETKRASGSRQSDTK